ncbi:MAG: hypothetical protein JWP58_2530 [Hymenobacter sp.]|nr:hypothetical protein [Hymenobacter sp.]
MVIISRYFKITFCFSKLINQTNVTEAIYLRNSFVNSQVFLAFFSKILA